MTFLVVEDQPIIRTIARIYLEEAGFVVSAVKDGREALKHCSDSMPDAILLEREMPDMDGVMFIAELRKRPGGGRPKVISCTTSRVRNQAGFLRAVGADGFVEKPFEERHLMIGLQLAGLLGCDRIV